MKHVITYPGFAERADAQNLFFDIRDAAPKDYEFHILPFYEEQPNGDRLIRSIAEHAMILQNYMDNLDGEITMLAKCGGTRPVVSMDDEHISRLEKLCLFNPPWKVSKGFLKEQLLGWKGTEHDDSSWSLPRGGGKNYVVSKEYMQTATTLDIMERYQSIAHSHSTEFIIVRSLNDEVFDPIRTEKLTGAKFIDIEGGNHHLVKESRPKVLAALALHNVL